MTNYRCKVPVNFDRAVVDCYSSRWFVQVQWWMDLSNRNSALERNCHYSFVDLARIPRYCSVAMANHVALAVIGFHCNDLDVSVEDCCAVVGEDSSIAVPTISMDHIEMDPDVDSVSDCSSSNCWAHHHDDCFLHLVDPANCLV